MRLYTTASSRENPNIAWAILFAVTSREKFSMNNSKNGLRRTLYWRGLCSILVASLAFVWPAAGQTKAARSSATPASLEQRAEANLKVARENPLQLRQFLLKMPKGGDLHNHLSGAVYAESWIRAGAEDHLCVDVAKLAFTKPPAASSGGVEQNACGEGKVPAEAAFRDQKLYDALVDAFSMRGFVPSPGVTGHDHFFDTFSKFGGTDHRHTGEWIDEVATRAAAQNEQYLELMHTPDFSHTAAIAKEIGWREDFGSLREALLARGLRDDLAVAKTAVDHAEGLRAQREHCGQADAAGGRGVDVMYEDYPHALLKEMAAKHVMVEISQTSNDLILGVGGKEHPFLMYKMFGVPMALATDDEGVSRIDLTHEYVRAVESYDLHYADLKRMARTSVEHSFLPGESLWSAPDALTRAVAPCSRDSLGAKKPSSACAAFLKGNERAQQQWELERRFHAFESQL